MFYDFQVAYGQGFKKGEAFLLLNEIAKDIHPLMIGRQQGQLYALLGALVDAFRLLLQDELHPLEVAGSNRLQ